MSSIQAVIDKMKLLTDKRIDIAATYSIYGRSGPYTGGAISPSGQLQQFQSGGFITGNANSVFPATLHPNEVVLNSQQQARLLMKLATTKTEVRERGDNIFNITSPNPLTESEIKMQINLLSRELGHRMAI